MQHQLSQFVKTALQNEQHVTKHKLAISWEVGVTSNTYV